MNFGYVKEGSKVQQMFSIRNDDNITNRVLVRCNNVCISLELFIGGSVINLLNYLILRFDQVKPSLLKLLLKVILKNQNYINQEMKKL